MHSVSAQASHWYWPLNLSEFHCCSITQRKMMTAHLSYKEPNTATEASLKAPGFAQELKDSPIGIFSFLYMGIYHICIICRDSKPKVWASPQQQEPAAVWPSSFQNQSVYWLHWCAVCPVIKCQHTSNLFDTNAWTLLIGLRKLGDSDRIQVVAGTEQGTEI